MEKFTPFEKLSKKKKRELNAKRRGTWGSVNPVTRKTKNPKAYDRKKTSCDRIVLVRQPHDNQRRRHRER